MGLLKHLLFWPVTGPVALAKYSVRQVDGFAKRELTDDRRIHEDLMALQMDLELGSIDEVEYERREAEIMDRLREARAWRRRLGMEEEWAPLEFPHEPAEAKEATDDEPGPTRTSSPPAPRRE